MYYVGSPQRSTWLPAALAPGFLAVTAPLLNSPHAEQRESNYLSHVAAAKPFKEAKKKRERERERERKDNGGGKNNNFQTELTTPLYCQISCYQL